MSESFLRPHFFLSAQHEICELFFLAHLYQLLHHSSFRTAIRSDDHRGIRDTTVAPFEDRPLVDQIGP